MSRTLYIAFHYTTPICPPARGAKDERDPRDYKAGKCLGAFVTEQKAADAVENAAFPAGTGIRYPENVTWDHPGLDGDHDTMFMRAGNTFYGCVEVVILERRADDRRTK